MHKLAFLPSNELEEIIKSFEFFWKPLDGAVPKAISYQDGRHQFCSDVYKSNSLKKEF